MLFSTDTRTFASRIWALTNTFKTVPAKMYFSNDFPWGRWLHLIFSDDLILDVLFALFILVLKTWGLGTGHTLQRNWESSDFALWNEARVFIKCSWLNPCFKNPLMLITLPNIANFSYMVDSAEKMVMRQLQLHLELVKSTDVSQMIVLRLVQHSGGSKLWMTSYF